MSTPESRPAATPPRPASRLWIKVLIVAVVLGFAALAATLLPRGYSQDFSLIGKGGNVVVLVHDHNKLVSMENMGVVNKLRGEYEGRVTFLVADVLAPEGAEFARSHNINSIALVFFAPNGDMLGASYAQENVESLRKRLNEAFHL